MHQHAVHAQPTAAGHRPFDDAATLYTSLARTAYDAIVTTGGDGVILQWNCGAERLCGYPAAEAVGRPVGMLLPPERAAEWHSLAERIARGESPDPFETVWTRKDGSPVDVSVSVSGVQDGRGTLIGLTAIARDITGYKRAERKLGHVLEQLAEAQALARVGSWEWDTRSDRVLWSEELYRLSGVDPARFPATYEGVLELIHPDDRDRLRAVVDRAYREGTPYVCEHRVVRPDGTVRWWQSRGAVLSDEAGRPIKLFGTGQDITERKRAEEALARYGALVESSEDAIITKSLDGVVLSWNAGAERLFGYRRQEVEGRSATVIVPPDRLEEFRAFLERIRRGARVAHHDTVRVRKDGSRVTVSLSISPIVDGGGRVVAASSIARDVTERQEAAERLARSQAQLRDFAKRLRTAREAERTAIAREIHDDLGQALTALKMDLSSLRRGAGATPPAQLDAKTRAMGELIDGMIDRVRTLASELRPAVLDGYGLAAAVDWAVRQFATRTDIRCVVRLPPAPVALDAGRSTDLFRILQEALTNVARHAAARCVTVTLGAAPGEITLEVRDDGRGVTAAQVESLAAFGLLGMRERALSWDGVVTVEPGPGGGTAVKARLPLGQGAPDAAA
jgi:PAS domain S-box-containing protein